MTGNLRLVTDRVAGFAVRQPRIAVGGFGLGAIMLLELVAILAGGILS